MLILICMLRLLFFIFLIHPQAMADDPYVLSIGESIELKTPASADIRIQRKGLLKVKDLGHKIRLIGARLGKTKVHIGKRVINFHILKKPIYETWIKLQEWSKNKRGPIISLQNKKVCIIGRLLTMQDILSLQELMNEHDKFENHTQISSQLKEELLKNLRKHLQENNIPDGHWSLSPSWSFSIENKFSHQLNLYKKILQPFGFRLNIQKMAWAQLPMVEVQLHIAHVKSSFLRQWGLQWPEEISGQIIDGSTFNMSNFQLSLKTLESQGLGRVLATPTLVAQSGNEARFHSGGEFPVKAIGQFAQTVQWKSYGVLLKIKPSVSAQDQLQLKIQAELSGIDTSHSEGGTPGLLKNEMETFIQMNELRPILISGLIRKEWGEDSSGLPWLRQIPMLSPLFSTSNHFDKQGQLVMILIPRLIRN